MLELYKVFVVDESGEETMLEFKPYSYRSLMDLVLNELWEEWGDCRGKAMCGTCHIEVLSDFTGEKEADEEQTLDSLPNKTITSRLACQLSLDSAIHNLKFRILKDY